jgi:predicted nuclease of predicted toxin-antitoxin system
MCVIMADADVEGHVERLVDYILASSWAEFWEHIGVRLESFPNVGLVDKSPDAEVWRTCQREQLVLITGNRNNDGPDSLEATIRGENTSASLPVLTIGDVGELRRSGEYAERVVARLIEILLDIDTYRGTGRLYLP